MHIRFSTIAFLLLGCIAVGSSDSQAREPKPGQTPNFVAQRDCIANESGTVYSENLNRSFFSPLVCIDLKDKIDRKFDKQKAVEAIDRNESKYSDKKGGVSPTAPERSEQADSIVNQTPIIGIHPIKRALQPIVDMGAVVVKLQQQVMELEKPIYALSSPMVSLQKKMIVVDDRINSMRVQLIIMDLNVVGVRADLAKMQMSIARLEKPIIGLQSPIARVSRPLMAVEAQLNQILFAILLATFAIAVGTPTAGFLIYLNRHRLFPGSSVQVENSPKTDTIQN